MRVLCVAIFLVSVFWLSTQAAAVAEHQDKRILAPVTGLLGPVSGVLGSATSVLGNVFGLLGSLCNPTAAVRATLTSVLTAALSAVKALNITKIVGNLVATLLGLAGGLFGKLRPLDAAFCLLFDSIQCILGILLELLASLVGDVLPALLSLVGSTNVLGGVLDLPGQALGIILGAFGGLSGGGAAVGGLAGGLDGLGGS